MSECPHVGLIYQVPRTATGEERTRWELDLHGAASKLFRASDRFPRNQQTAKKRVAVMMSLMLVGSKERSMITPAHHPRRVSGQQQAYTAYSIGGSNIWTEI